MLTIVNNLSLSDSSVSLGGHIVKLSITKGH